MQDYDDEPVQRPRWLGWVIIIGMILVVLGLLNLGARMIIGTSSDQVAAQTVAAVAEHNPALVGGKTLIDGSDCMRCHGVERKFVGPGLVEIAQRYKDRADAQAYLAQKIRQGSVGEWGRTIMPRHPQVTEAQSLEMAQWIMALADQKTP
ncbi:c-type cytochrome [Comamonas sp.]|uniref:c-type cytochrome n=1 Tax=Comamonas sp. TaxID=34028 RepID=UPI002586E379|nr:c-type cytochrome [Comamonas sp.]